jgi:uncharacterized protein (UPF0262 family)
MGDDERMGDSGAMQPAHRLVRIELDEAGTPRRSAEGAIAIYDILEDNSFALVDQEGAPLDGPFHLYLRSEGRHIRFDIRSDSDSELSQFYMALGPLRRVMRDYFQVCDTYYEAIRTKSPSQIQAIDMGRRALHNEGADILRSRLDGRVATDEMTSRRLFTLICVLQAR